jgi:hypothetical protein
MQSLVGKGPALLGPAPTCCGSIDMHVSREGMYARKNGDAALAGVTSGGCLGMASCWSPLREYSKGKTLCRMPMAAILGSHPDCCIISSGLKQAWQFRGNCLNMTMMMMAFWDICCQQRVGAPLAGHLEQARPLPQQPSIAFRLKRA